MGDDTRREFTWRELGVLCVVWAASPFVWVWRKTVGQFRK